MKDNETMNVLMLLSKPFKPEPWIYSEAKTLVNAGHRVKIIGWNREKGYKKKEKLDGIEIERISLQAPYGSFVGLLPLYPIFYLIIFIKSIFMNFDVVECHNFDTLPLGLLIGRFKRKKVVYHSLDLYFTWFARETSSKFKKKLSALFRKFENLSLNNIDHLIVVTPALLDYYKRYNIRCESTVLLNTPNKIFSKQFSQDKIEKKDNFVISYIGEIRYEKPLFNLIKATGKIDGVNVLIVGGGVKAENIKKKAKEYHHVSIVDEVPYKKVINYYNQSDCTYAVYDSKVENIKVAIPVKVFEAMAVGIPVIVNKNIWISNFVKKNRIGFCVDENNMEEIEQVILEIKKNRNLATEFGENGRKLFEEVYNWEKMEKRLLNVYENLEK